MQIQSVASNLMKLIWNVSELEDEMLELRFLVFLKGL